MCLIPHFVRAETTGTELLHECQAAAHFGSSNNLSDKEYLDGVHCVGYLSGVRDTLTLWHGENENDISPSGSRAFACVPTEATAQELAMVVVKYLNDHPNQLHSGILHVGLRVAQGRVPVRKRGEIKVSQICVDGKILARLIDHYLRLEIQTLHRQGGKPHMPLQQSLDLAESQGTLDYLLNQFEKCQTSEDYMENLRILEKLWNGRKAQEADES